MRSDHREPTRGLNIAEFFLPFGFFLFKSVPHLLFFAARPSQCLFVCSLDIQLTLFEDLAVVCEISQRFTQMTERIHDQENTVFVEVQLKQ